jgi:hypothetical protein
MTFLASTKLLHDFEFHLPFSTDIWNARIFIFASPLRHRTLRTLYLLFLIDSEIVFLFRPELCYSFVPGVPSLWCHWPQLYEYRYGSNGDAVETGDGPSSTSRRPSFRAVKPPGLYDTDPPEQTGKPPLPDIAWVL